MSHKQNLDRDIRRNRRVLIELFTEEEAALIEGDIILVDAVKYKIVKHLKETKKLKDSVLDSEEDVLGLIELEEQAEIWLNREVIGKTKPRKVHILGRVERTGNASIQSEPIRLAVGLIAATEC